MRDLRKSIEEYQKKFYNSNSGCFYASDIEQIAQLATDSGRVDLYEAISSALQAGFMVGYRYGKKEARKK